MNQDLFLVVMAGGSGTRFWPKSTSKRPKQLLSFGKGESHSLLAQTLARFNGIVPKNQSFVATTVSLSSAVKECVPGFEILAEPEGRNTAPCIYWAARRVAEKNPKGVMLIMPSDHLISDLSSFQKTLFEAIDWARSSQDLITLGVKPTRPETGYGYLSLGKKIQGNCQQVEAFIEKPNHQKAWELFQEGNTLWNGGMFLWRADVILKAFDCSMPEMKKIWEENGRQLEVAYPKLTATSIDYGVMEKADHVVTFPLDCGWDDLGSWTSLESVAKEFGGQHEVGVVSNGDVVSIDSTGNIIDAPGRLVALLGVKDLIVVEHGGAILVARKDQAQDIRQIVDLVKKTKPEKV